MRYSASNKTAQPRKDRRGQYVEIQGSPDWVLEVVSQSSVAKDTLELPVLYHRAQIGEYWLVDARGVEISFQILVRGQSAYEAIKPRAGWTRSPLFQRRFRLTRRLNRLGRWTYTLEMKP